MLVFENSKSKRYRSKTDIVAEILSVIKQPLGKTRIMYTAFISSEQTKEYLAELSAKGLLNHNECNKTYQITEQGIEFLRLYEAMKRLGR